MKLLYLVSSLQTKLALKAKGKKNKHKFILKQFIVRLRQKSKEKLKIYGSGGLLQGQTEAVSSVQNLEENISKVAVDSSTSFGDVFLKS